MQSEDQFRESDEDQLPDDDEEIYEDEKLCADDQLSRLRATHTLLQAGIHHVVWAEYAMAIAHYVPIGFTVFDLELLISPYDITRAAHLICLEHRYTPIDVRQAHGGYPDLFNPLSTVVLRHRGYLSSSYATNEPPYIYLHTPSTFRFDINNDSTLITNPNPPDESSGRLLYPSFIAFCDSIIDTIHEPLSSFLDFHEIGGIARPLNCPCW